MQCAELQGTALVLRPGVSLEACTGATAIVVADPSDYAAQQITAQNIGYAFSWGFGAVILFWSLGYFVGVAKRLISHV